MKLEHEISYRIQRGVGWGGGPDPLENHKAIRDLSNIGLDPQRNHKKLPSQHSMIGHHGLAIGVLLWADDGPLLVLFGSSLPWKKQRCQKLSNQIFSQMATFFDKFRLRRACASSF